MYPFERFTEAAKGTLVLAQREAERSRLSYVGTEHVLTALVTQRGTIAGETLARLSVPVEGVRARIDEVLGRRERQIIRATIVPTTRVKTVIETSFAEARRAGSDKVWTDHLLVALLVEGQGVAAHVLEEFGATLEVVRDTAARVRQEGIDESKTPHQGFFPHSGVATMSQVTPLSSPSWLRDIAPGAAEEARADLDEDVRQVHVLRYILKKPDARVAAVLRRLGVDAAQLYDALRPPERVLELRRAVRDAVTEKRAAVDREDYEAAAVARQREVELRAALDAAEAEWEKEEG